VYNSHIYSWSFSYRLFISDTDYYVALRLSGFRPTIGPDIQWIYGLISIRISASDVATHTQQSAWRLDNWL